MTEAIEQAFADHRQAQRIREAIAYLKVGTNVAADSMAQWADDEVMDAAEKYAAYLEMRAYKGEER